MLQVRIRNGTSTRSQVIPGDIAALGRSADNDVVLDDDSVSRRHARLTVQNGAVLLEDLGGTNGTRLNEQLLRKETRRVGPDDTIVIGPFQVAVRVAQPTAAPRPQPAVTAAPAPVRAAPSPQQRPATPPVQPPAGAVAASFAPPVRVPAPATRPVLHVRVPDGQFTVPLVADETRVGRGPDNDIIIDLPAISIHHAHLRRRGDRWEVVDQHSRNGTKLNDRPVETAPLTEGDIIELAGSTTLVFALPGVGLPGTAAQAPIPGTQLLRELPAPTAGHPAVITGPTPIPKRRAQSRRFIPHPAGAARITVGRAPTNELVLDSPQVSREHAVIERSGAAAPWVITDLHTTNRTYVNNEAITQRTLAEGDVIRVGPSRLTVRQGEIEHFDETAGIVLEAQSLVKIVGKGVRILQNVSLVIEPHEFVGIVGVSGAGKSTLLGALAGLRPATSGQVLLNGFSLYEHFDSMRLQIGYVPQDDIIHKELSVERALDYAARLRMPEDISKAERSARVNEVIDELGLQPQRKTPVANLSGGQRKRVSIGVELLTKPPLFFLDEPTSGLDPGTETRMMGLLRQLADQGRTVLLITHATRNIAMCDKVVFMARGGRLAFYGPPREALTYFGVAEFEDIYDLIENQRSPEEWENQFKASALYDSEIVARMTNKAPDGSSSPATGTGIAMGTARPKSNRFRQFGILTQRYGNIVINDRKNLAILLIQAPIIALLLFLLIDSDVFHPPGPYTIVHSIPRPALFKGTSCDESQILAGKTPDGCKPDDSNGGEINAATLAFILAATAVWLGTLNAIREISKEDAIYRRERVVNLRVIAYVASKLAILMLLVLVQSSLLLGVARIHIAFPDSALFGIWLSLVLGGAAAVSIALAISAAVSNPDRAVFAAPLIMLPQIFFGGLLFPKLNRALSAPVTARWTYEAIGRAAKVYKQAKLPDITRKPSLDGAAWGHWLVLLGFVVLFSVLAVGLQRMKDRR